MLKLMGEFIMTLVTFISGSGLDRYIVANLFKINPKRNRKKKVEYMENTIAPRKPARFNPFNCLWS